MFTFSCGGTHKCVQSRKKWDKMWFFREPEGWVRKTSVLGKMLIIPPPLAAALHRSGHMLLYKLFPYNGRLYQAATRLFRIQIKCLDFNPPPSKRRNLCGHKRPQPGTLFIVPGCERRKLLTWAIEKRVTDRQSDSSQLNFESNGMNWEKKKSIFVGYIPNIFVEKSCSWSFTSDAVLYKFVSKRKSQIFMII